MTLDSGLSTDQALRLECARLATNFAASTNCPSTSVAPMAIELYGWITETPAPPAT